MRSDIIDGESGRRKIPLACIDHRVPAELQLCRLCVDHSAPAVCVARGDLAELLHTTAVGDEPDVPDAAGRAGCANALAAACERVHVAVGGPAGARARPLSSPYRRPCPDCPSARTPTGCCPSPAEVSARLRPTPPCLGRRHGPGVGDRISRNQEHIAAARTDPAEIDHGRVRVARPRERAAASEERWTIYAFDGRPLPDVDQRQPTSSRHLSHRNTNGPNCHSAPLQ